jgi:hypothetical protein
MLHTGGTIACLTSPGPQQQDVVIPCPSRRLSSCERVHLCSRVTPSAVPRAAGSHFQLTRPASYRAIPATAGQQMPGSCPGEACEPSVALEYPHARCQYPGQFPGAHRQLGSRRLSQCPVACAQAVSTPCPDAQALPSSVNASPSERAPGLVRVPVNPEAITSCITAQARRRTVQFPPPALPTRMQRKTGQQTTRSRQADRSHSQVGEHAG